jgi:plasmid stabilization system protein ParE
LSDVSSVGGPTVIENVPRSPGKIASFTGTMNFGPYASEAESHAMMDARALPIGHGGEDRVAGLPRARDSGRPRPTSAAATAASRSRASPRCCARRAVEASVRVLRRSQLDLVEIQAYVARDRPEAAEALVDALVGPLRTLERFPQRGAVPRDARLRRAGYRYLAHGDYLVFCRVLSRKVRPSRDAGLPICVRMGGKEEGTRVSPDVPPDTHDDGHRSTTIRTFGHRTSPRPVDTPRGAARSRSAPRDA